MDHCLGGKNVLNGVHIILKCVLHGASGSLEPTTMFLVVPVCPAGGIFAAS